MITIYKLYKFYDSSLVPHLELMCDTKDAIRIFTGGKRMTHFNIDKIFLSKLRKYLFNKDSTFMLKSFVIKITNNDLPKMLAGYFILHYFSKLENYRIPKNIDSIISHINTS